MIRAFSCSVVVVTFVAGCADCGEPAPVIVEGEGEDGGEGEGAEGEGEGPVGDCPALADAEFGDPIALVVPRSRHTAALLDDGRVMLIGGEDDGFGQIADVEIVDPAAGTSVRGPSLLTPRYEHASVVLKNGHVVVAGGFGPGGHLTSIEVFDGTEWTAVGDLDEARAGLSGFLVDDEAVFFGGDNTTSIPTSVVSVDEGNVVAVTGVNVGQNRRSHAAAQRDDGSVVVVGGFFTAAIADVVEFNLDGQNDLPSIPGPRRQAAAGRIGAGIVVAGGLGAAGYRDDVELLGANGWTQTSSLRAARAAPVVAAVGDCIAVCGGLEGDFTDSDNSDTCEGIDAAGVRLPMVDLPFATFSFTLTELGDGALLFAGGSLDGFVHVAEARVLVAP